jgi:hypothetical protein
MARRARSSRSRNRRSSLFHHLWHHEGLEFIVMVHEVLSADIPASRALRFRDPGGAPGVEVLIGQRATTMSPRLSCLQTLYAP